MPEIAQTRTSGIGNASFCRKIVTPCATFALNSYKLFFVRHPHDADAKASVLCGARRRSVGRKALLHNELHISGRAAPHHEKHKLLNDNALRTTFRRKITNFVNVLSVKSESLSFLSTDFFI